MICELLGVPEMDRAEFRELSTQAVAPTDSDSGYDAIVRLAQYLRDLIEDKRRAGHSGDLLSDLIRTTAEDGDRLSPQELRGMAFILLIASTTRRPSTSSPAASTLCSPTPTNSPPCAPT